MGYAVTAGSWRAVNSPADIVAGETYQDAQPGPWPFDAMAYANKKRWQLTNGGLTVTFTGGPTVKFGTDTEGKALLNGNTTRQGRPNPPATVRWQNMATGTFVTLTAAQVLSAGDEVADFIKTCFATLDTIQSNPTLYTTQAQIDAAPWPSNSVTI